MRTALVIALWVAGCGGSARPAPANAPAEPLAEDDPAAAVHVETHGVAECTAPNAPGRNQYELGSELDEHDPARAAGLYDAACEAGNMCACGRLARLFERGLGVSRDPARAAELYERSCEHDVAPACVGLGYCLSTGACGPSDPARERALFDRACELDPGSGCAALGMSVLDANPADVAAAGELFDRACDAGDPVGCLQLAMLLLRGDAADGARAESAFRASCERGIPIACAYLGRLLLSGGDPAQQPLAIELYGYACMNEDYWACRVLGEAFAQGLGVPQDLDRARQLLSESCDHDIGEACTSLAGVAPSDQRDALLHRGCDHRDPVACDRIAGEPPVPDASVLPVDPSSVATQIALDRGSDRTRTPATIGGSIALTTLALRPSCVGYVDAVPTAIVSVGDRIDRVLFRTEARVDSTLVVRGPDGRVTCADDVGAGIFHAEIVLPGQPGEYQVWVGVFDAAYTTDGALITAPVLDPAPPAPVRRPRGRR